MEKYLKTKICHLPWTSIETRPSGNYKPCCLYREDLKDELGNKYTARQHSISDVMNSPVMEQLRAQFLAGEMPEGCSSCWKEEDAGKTSKRQHMWYKAGVLGQLHIEKDIVAPRFIDLKLGNICNLKCRICSPHSSSQWVGDMIQVDSQRKDYWRQYNIDGMWPREENEFYKDLEQNLEHIRFFEITGGEPLMIKEQFEILQKCVDAGVAKNIEIHYNTNGTQFPEHAVNEIWPHFKKLEIAFSIDDVEDRFEYQRNPAKWDEVNRNIQRFMTSGLHNLTTQVCTTINVFNIMYLDELAPVVAEWAPDFWYINILHNPAEFDVQQLPAELKHKITEKLNKTTVYPAEIQTAIDYLNRIPSHELPDWKDILTHKIKTIDGVRAENFKIVFPELNKELKIYE